MALAGRGSSVRSIGEYHHHLSMPIISPAEIITWFLAHLYSTVEGVFFPRNFEDKFTES